MRSIIGFTIPSDPLQLFTTFWNFIKGEKSFSNPNSFDDVENIISLFRIVN